jgi:two-component system sensor histidine kinase KdpD
VGLWAAGSPFADRPQDPARGVISPPSDPDGIDNSADHGVDSGLGEASPAQPVDETGRFRVYLGAAPGVGKTFSMLDEGRRRLERGRDVVIGFVECHGRERTEELVHSFETVAPRLVEYRGSTFPEMDLDAVLARRPQVALVDELAHTNVPGSGRHDKRWKDVVELLDANIDVVTTVNIQHLESIADAVERIIEVPIRERVPDWVLRKANQIELVDSSPEQLRRRMIHGNIYPAEQVPQALAHYFRTENLTALRELALRFLADETEDQLLEYLRRQQKGVVWETRERILVGITAAPGTDGIMRRAARMASRIKADLQVLHVVGANEKSRFPNDRLISLRQLSADVGAEWNELRSDDPAQALIEFARLRHFTQIVVGSSGRTRFQELLGGGSVVRKIARLAATSAIDVHIIARRDPLVETDHNVEAVRES